MGESRESSRAEDSKGAKKRPVWGGWLLVSLTLRRTFPYILNRRTRRSQRGRGDFCAPTELASVDLGLRTTYGSRHAGT